MQAADEVADGGPCGCGPGWEMALVYTGNIGRAPNYTEAMMFTDDDNGAPPPALSEAHPSGRASGNEVVPIPNGDVMQLTAMAMAFLVAVLWVLVCSGKFGSFARCNWP